jgi:spore germination cell wall hydrolase CwlJ-like protein
MNYLNYQYGEPLENKSGLSEFEGRGSVDLLARMIYSEARGESWAGKQGVAHVTKNRKAKASKVIIALIAAYQTTN